MAQWLVHWGVVLGAPGLKLQGTKLLFRSTALALAVLSLPLQPHDAVILKKASLNSPGMLGHWQTGAYYFQTKLLDVHSFITNRIVAMNIPISSVNAQLMSLI